MAPRISLVERFLVEAGTEVVHAMLNVLPPHELNIFSVTSKIVRDIVLQYASSAWNVDVFLQLWFNEPQRFRDVLAFTGAVVGGSQVIQFLDRQPPRPESDLDVVTRMGGLLSLAIHLETEGYRHTPGARCTNEYPGLASILSVPASKAFQKRGGKSGLLRVFDFEKKVVVEKEKQRRFETRKVQVIAVAENPVEHILFNYHSTGVMNFITHKEAISLYPKTTFLDRTFYVNSTHPLGPKWRPGWMDKYESRGFVFDRVSDSPATAVGPRFVGDKVCWRLRFPDNGEACQRGHHAVYEATTLEDIEFESFWLWEKGETDTANTYRFSLQPPNLWYFLWPWFYGE